MTPYAAGCLGMCDGHALCFAANRERHGITRINARNVGMYSMSECRPPPGTKDGAVCWLTTGTHWATLEWDSRLSDQWNTRETEPGVWWDRIEDWHLSPLLLARKGWRFHSIATPPEEPKP